MILAGSGKSDRLLGTLICGVGVLGRAERVQCDSESQRYVWRIAQRKSLARNRQAHEHEVLFPRIDSFRWAHDYEFQIT